MKTRRTAEHLIKRVREELRAEGPQGGGYSDFIILDALNTALDDLSDIFTIRDTVTFDTVADQNSYDIADVLGVEVFELLRVSYDGKVIRGKPIDVLLNKAVEDEGPVREWFLWGHELTFAGKVEADKEVKMWVNRGPKFISEFKQVPDTPRYADEALISYALSVCYRESKDFERAFQYYRIYNNRKAELLSRSVPQMQRDFTSQMRDDYASPFRGSRRFFYKDYDPRRDV